MAQTIQIRRDTAANWTTANSLLAQGELGYETDTGKLKVGDGTTAWNSLAYHFAQLGGDIAQTFSVAPATSGTHALQAQQSIGINVVVNGGCEVSQVNGTTLTTPITSSYPIDNVFFQAGAASKLQTQQVTNVLNSLGAVSALQTTVFASYTPAAGDRFAEYFPIEGRNFARFQYGTANAKAGSLQFKVRSSVSGTFSGSIQNYAQTRSYPFSFSVTANTDTQIKIENIPGDTGGTWVGAVNAGAAYVCFDMGTGTSGKSTANSWQAANYQGVTGSTNFVAQANGSALTITDVQFEVGSFCSAFERKLYAQVLAECSRYLPVIQQASGSYFLGMAAAINATTTDIAIPLPVETMVAVTGVTIAGAGSIVFGSTITNPSATAIYIPNTKVVALSCTTIGGTAGFGTIAYLNGAISLVFTGSQI